MTDSCLLNRRALIAGFLAGSSVGARAQTGTYPNRSIKVVVGVPPGGSTDMMTRMYAAFIAEQLGQPTIVDNRPGANTTLGNHAVAQAPPDGYTILVNTDAIITVPHLVKSLPYDTFKSLTPIGTFGTSPFVTVVHPSLPIHSISDLVAYAKANPGKVHFGTSGNGSSSHLGGEKLKVMTGATFIHVPYRGAGPALTDALSGQYQFSSWTPLAAAGHVAAGRLRALAVSSPRRLAALPGVPTYAEAGFPEYKHRAWWGLFAPAGTPQPIISQLNDLIAKMVNLPATRKKFEENGVEPFLNSPDQFAALMREESAEIEKLVKAAGITAN